MFISSYMRRIFAKTTHVIAKGFFFFLGGGGGGVGGLLFNQCHINTKIDIDIIYVFSD